MAKSLRRATINANIQIKAHCVNFNMINMSVRTFIHIIPNINKIIQEFKIVIKKGIQLNNRKLVNTILYADDQILMATSEDDLQTMAYHLNLYCMKDVFFLSH